jgi:hypothetical protein
VKIPTPDVNWNRSSGIAVNLDNGVDHDNNGIQPGGAGTQVHSPIISLQFNSEPGALGSTNLDSTIDFGFAPSLSIGDLVWSDENDNGLHEPGEGGVSGAVVELFSTVNQIVGDSDDAPVGAPVVTDVDGAYRLTGLSVGKYYLKITPPVSHPVVSTISVNGDNGINGDNNGVSQAGSGLPIFTPVITLAGLTEPGTKAVPFRNQL